MPYELLLCAGGAAVLSVGCLSVVAYTCGRYDLSEIVGDISKLSPQEYRSKVKEIFGSALYYINMLGWEAAYRYHMRETSISSSLTPKANRIW